MREYRVLWQRAGQAKKRDIYQTLAGATACADRQRSASQEMDWLTTPLPEIVWGPFIEARDVTDWEPLD